jgi:hypothetical protein
MTGSIVCALLVTAGLFLLTGVRPRDMTVGLMKPFEKEVNRKKRIRHMTGKKPSAAQRMMEEAVTMLDASCKGEQIATYRNMATLLAAVGFLFGLVIDNLPVSLVLSIELAMTPLTIIRMRTAEYGRMVDEKLEMAMGSVTNSYIATGNLLIAVERVLPMLPAPVGDIFKRFQVDMQYVDGNTVRAIQHMREASDNWYWTKWCNAFIQCQDDVTLNRTLSGIARGYLRCGRSRWRWTRRCASIRWTNRRCPQARQSAATPAKTAMFSPSPFRRRFPPRIGVSP